MFIIERKKAKKSNGKVDYRFITEIIRHNKEMNELAQQGQVLETVADYFLDCEPDLCPLTAGASACTNCPIKGYL